MGRYISEVEDVNSRGSSVRRSNKKQASFIHVSTSARQQHINVDFLTCLGTFRPGLDQ